MVAIELEQGLLKVVVTSPRGEERILAMLGPGAIVGELAIIDGGPRSASVFAVRDCELSFISRAVFKERTIRHPEIYQYVINVLATRLRRTDEAMAATSFLTVKARLARALLELGKHVGQDDGAGRVVIRHKISRSDLAAMAGVARENVSRVMSDWKQNQVITRSSGLYCLSDVATLKREMDTQVEPVRTARNGKKRLARRTKSARLNKSISLPPLDAERDCFSLNGYTLGGNCDHRSNDFQRLGYCDEKRMRL